MNPDVPVEATFKWLLKERDHLQDKLDTLVPYTKALELRIEEIAQERDVLEANLARYKAKAEGAVLADTQRQRLRKRMKDLAGQMKCILNEFGHLEENLL